ncbi:MAG: hypothetical protein GY830_00090 [Bacteroidetes bacterium]|nr:hypothetical protein [Bacteroidota bacterium]
MIKTFEKYIYIRPDDGKKEERDRSKFLISYKAYYRNDNSLNCIKIDEDFFNQSLKDPKNKVLLKDVSQTINEIHFDKDGKTASKILYKNKSHSIYNELKQNEKNYVNKLAKYINENQINKMPNVMILKENDTAYAKILVKKDII